MTRHPLTSRLEPIFREILDPGLALHNDLTLAQVPEWDSLSNISLIVAIEAEFGIEIPADELAAFKNVGDLARIIAKQLGTA